MNDEKMAKDYNIEGGSVLHLVSAVCVKHIMCCCFKMMGSTDSQSTVQWYQRCMSINVDVLLQVLALRGGQ